MASTSSSATKEERLAADILEEFGITKEQLPVDVDAILAAKGFVVREEELPESLAAVLDTRQEGKPVLLVDKNQDEKQLRFVKACELGHFLLDKDFRGVRTDKKSPLANIPSASYTDAHALNAERFAYALLMPKTLLSEQVRDNADKSDDDLAGKLGTIFGVSAIAAVAGLVLYALFGGKEK